MVRYLPGQFYKPHHDFDNGCDTWLQGNRHFTFLVYLNTVEGEGAHQTPSTCSLLVEVRLLIMSRWTDELPAHQPDCRTDTVRANTPGIAPQPRMIAPLAVTGCAQVCKLNRCVLDTPSQHAGTRHCSSTTASRTASLMSARSTRAYPPSQEPSTLSIPGCGKTPGPKSERCSGRHTKVDHRFAPLGRLPLLTAETTHFSFT